MAGAGAAEPFPPRAPGTLSRSVAVRPRVFCRVVVCSKKVCLTAFVLSVGALHGFIAHLCLLHSQLLKVQSFLHTASDFILFYVVYYQNLLKCG